MIVTPGTTTLLVLALLQTPALSMAQSSLAQGARVRVTAPGAARLRLTGTILAATEKTLTIVDKGGQTVRIPRELVTRLDVSNGGRRHALHGLVVGAALGALIGGLREPACGEHAPGDPGCYTHGQEVAIGGVAFGLMGAWGGWNVRSEKWVDVPLDRFGVSLGGSMSGRGADLNVGITF